MLVQITPLLAARVGPKPSSTIFPDSDLGATVSWLSLNRKYAGLCPNLSLKMTPPADASDWDGVMERSAILAMSRIEMANETAKSVSLSFHDRDVPLADVDDHPLYGYTLV